MGKTPVLGMVGFCWLSIALAGCDTVGNNNNTQPKQKFAANPTFGAPKDTTISKNAAADATAKDKLAGAGVSDNMTAGPGVTPRPNPPAASAGSVVSVPGPTLSTGPTAADNQKVLPVVTADDTPTPALYTTGRPSLPSIKSDATPVALPPPPGGNGSMQLPPSAQAGMPLPQLPTPATTDKTGWTRQTTPPASDPLSPPPPPALPGGKPLDPPPQSLLKPNDNPPPIHEVPAPAPVPPAPPAPPPPVNDTALPPPPPPVPYSPGTPR